VQTESSRKRNFRLVLVEREREIERDGEMPAGNIHYDFVSGIDSNFSISRILMLSSNF